MPIHKENGGEQWGSHGKVYHGPNAKKKAEEQAAAAHANGYRGDEGDGEESADPIVPAGRQCAGLLFRAPGPNFLLVKRSDNGLWEQPGGHVEGGESTEDAAARESREEIGKLPDGPRWAFRHNQADGVDYTTFIQDVAVFKPTLNDEHVDWIWVSPDKLPEATHPETRISIELARGNELDVARSIADDILLSPQRYENVWLFDLRITGTGASYRSGLKEYVYRQPEEFLTEDFVARCNGLPVIFEHPDKNILNSDEYRTRNIGTVMLPYIRDDEVRGIVRIYDDDGATLMRTTHSSTSPAVVFRDAGSTESVQLDNGQTLLIEGNPSYIDHIAICEAGVWDKGGEPTGINNGDETVADENKHDEAPAWASTLLEKVDALTVRMDAAERKDEDEKEEKKDEDELAKEAKEEEEREKEERSDESEEDEDDEKKADAEEDEKVKDKERADAQDRENAELRAQIQAMQSRFETITAQPTAADRDALAAAQARADSVAQMFGERASPPLAGEDPVAYRKRLAAKFQTHCKKFKDVRLDSLEGPVFEQVEETIYADAQTTALNPVEPTPGRLIPMTRQDAAGRTITTFAGDPMAWMKHFMTGKTVCKFNTALASQRKEMN